MITITLLLKAIVALQITSMVLLTVEYTVFSLSEQGYDAVNQWLIAMLYGGSVLIMGIAFARWVFL